VATPAPVTSSSPQELVRATRPFAQEWRWRSWWLLSTTFLALIGMVVIATIAPWWWARVAASLVAALMMVRGFILFHDFMHHAILRDSMVANVIMHLFGSLLLVPPRAWKASHNYHHAHVGKIAESHVGSFPIMTVAQWRAAGFGTRLHYRFARSPLNILLAYVTVFFFSSTLQPFLRHPLKHWDSALAIGIHGGTIAVAWWFGGFWAPFFAVILPFAVASMMGAYLFYAQHNYPGMRCLTPDEWQFHRAALESCSYTKLGRVMRWFTGDIGFHHVHHLNAGIPFYRLEEAMQAIPACRDPVVTTLWPGDILACLRLKLWDPAAGRMVGYGGA
jgi:omega-6 fatty acid desaturase (delta-12 desaturase)